MGTSGITKMDDGSDLEESLEESDSESGSDYDFPNVNRAAKKRPLKYKLIVYNGSSNAQQ